MITAACRSLRRFSSIAIVLLATFLGPAAAAQQAEADLGATKSGPAEWAAGEAVTYDVTIFNFGPDAATGATLSDAMPAGMVFMDIAQQTGPAFTCVTPNPGDPGTVECQIASLAAGESATFAITMEIAPAPPGTTFTNTAFATSESFDPNEENNAGSASTTIPLPSPADLAVMKSGPASAGPDTDVTFTIELTNAGPSAATNVTLTDTLPGTLTFVSLNGGAELSCSTPAIGAGGTVTCTAASLASGVTSTLLLTAHVPSGTPAGTEFTNTAWVTSDADPNEENNSGTTTFFVVSADLAVSKSGPATAVAGDEIAYTITVENLGPNTAQAIVLTDLIPANATFVSIVSSAPASCDESILCTIGELAPSNPITFTVTLRAGGDISLTNTASVAADTAYDSDPSNNSSSVTTAIMPSADLAVTKDGPASATAGTSVTYDVVLTNNGPSDAVGVTLTDALPASARFTSLDQTSGPALSCATPAPGATGSIVCTAATFAAGETAAFTIVASIAPDATGTADNSATVTAGTGDPIGANNTDAVSTALTASADVRVTKTAPASITAGTNATFTISVANDGPSDASAVSLSDTLPAGTTFVSMTQIAGPLFNCTTPAAGGTGTVTCTIATLVPAASAQFELVLNVPASASGSIVNTATVAASTTDANSTNNSATATAPVAASADLAVTKTGPATIAAGTTATFTIGVTNNGPSDAATVTLADTLPPGSTFASLTQTSGPTFNCTTPAAGATGAIQCTIATLASAASSQFVLVVNVTPEAIGGLSNAATVSSPTPDPVNANNSATATAPLTTSADLSISKSGPASVQAGANLTYAIVVTNSGPAAAANVTLTDTLPAQTTFVSLTQTAGPTFNCTTGATITCTIASLSITSAAFELVVHVDDTATGTISNTAQVASTTADPTPANGAATAAAAVLTADVSITKTSSAPSAPIASQLTWTIVVTNAGPAPSTGTVVTDVLPAGVSLVSASSTQGTCSGTTTVTCDVGTLAAGASATITLDVILPQSIGTIENTATVTANEVDVTPANNSATAAVDVTLSNVAAIPTLSEWMLALLAMGMAAAFVMRVRS